MTLWIIMSLWIKHWGHRKRNTYFFIYFLGHCRTGVKSGYALSIQFLYLWINQILLFWQIFGGEKTSTMNRVFSTFHEFSHCSYKNNLVKVGMLFACKWFISLYSHERPKPFDGKCFTRLYCYERHKSFACKIGLSNCSFREC